MKESQNKQTNDLLPQRKSNLGRFILLAVVIHVVAAILYFQFKVKSPEEKPGIKVKPEKIISKPAAEKLMHTLEETGIELSKTATTQRSSMHSEMLTAAALPKQEAIPAKRFMGAPIKPVPPPASVTEEKALVLNVPSPTSASVTQSQAAFNKAGAGRLMLPERIPPPPATLSAAMAYPSEAGKPLSGHHTLMDILRIRHLERPVLERPDASASVSSRQKPIAASATPARHDRVFIKTEMAYPAEADTPLAVANTPQDFLRVRHLKRNAPAKPSAAAFVISRQTALGDIYTSPSSAPMPIKNVLAAPGPPPLTLPETHEMSTAILKSPPSTQSQATFSTAAARLSMLPATVRHTLVPGKAATVYPAEAGRPVATASALMGNLRVSDTGRPAPGKPVAAAAVIPRQKTNPDLKTLFPIGQSDGYGMTAAVSLLPASGLEPNLPPLPDPLSDGIFRALERLSQSIKDPVNTSPAPILVKNITYRDKGLESEGTKYLSGRIRSEVTHYGQMHLLAPKALTRPHHFELEGELWDEPDRISIKLRIKKNTTNKELGSTGIDIAKQLLPPDLAVPPPKGKSLDIVTQVVAMMQQVFSPPADFLVSVSPDKGLDAVYSEGESFTASILTEKSAYLRIDFYQVDGKVIHILPNPYQSNRVNEGAPFFIGDPEGPYQFIVSEPFGQELLVVIASQTPVLLETGSIIEPAEPYIKKLHQVLGAQKAKGEMAAAHYILVTQKGRKDG